MELKACFCTRCGAPIQVDFRKDRVVCEYCDTVFLLKQGDYELQNVKRDNTGEAVSDLRDINFLWSRALKQFEMNDYKGAIKSCDEILFQDDAYYRAWELKARSYVLLYNNMTNFKGESVLKFARNALINVPIKEHQVLANKMQTLVCDYAYMLLEEISNVGVFKQAFNDNLIFVALEVYLAALKFKYVNDNILRENCDKLLYKLAERNADTYRESVFVEFTKTLKPKRAETYEESIKKLLKEGLVKNELEYWQAYPEIAIKNKARYLAIAQSQLEVDEKLEKEIERLEMGIAHYQNQIDASGKGFWAERLGVFEEQKIKIYQYKEQLKENLKVYDREMAIAIKKKVQFLKSC